MFGAITRVMSVIGICFVAVMTLVTVADVVLRWSIDSPIKGAIEIVQYMMILIVFLTIPYVQYKKAHVSISLLVDKLPQKAQAVIGSFVYILSLGIIGLMTTAAFIYFRRIWEAERYTTVLGIPISPFQLILTIGLFLLFIMILLDFLHSIFEQVGR
ncbi:MAG: TRAP transporter small permease [Dehalococcoidales bacterium]|nr:TRAP transporter small permease [Dehalococcoidales bacterium]